MVHKINEKMALLEKKDIKKDQRQESWLFYDVRRAQRCLLVGAPTKIIFMLKEVF